MIDEKTTEPEQTGHRIAPVVLRVGSTIRFAEDDAPYTIRATSKRYGVCVRQMNDKDREDFEYEGDDSPPIYTIIDWQQMERGSHNLVFNPFDFETEEGCQECIKAMEEGTCEFSRRSGRTIPLVLSE